MFRKVCSALCLLIGLVLSSACNAAVPTPTPIADMPNPASVFCEENGGRLEIRQDASGGEAGVCIFPDGSECDEWAFSRGECKPGDSLPSIEPTATIESPPTQEPTPPLPVAEPFPTPLPIDPVDYQGWWTYTSPAYGFTLLLPSDWMVDETTSSDMLLYGHLLNIHPQQGSENINIRMTFRRSGEEVLLWPTGAGEGGFIQNGTLEVAGQPARRVLFVCPAGQVNSVYYQGEDGPNIQRGELEFGFIFGFTGLHCQEGYSPDGKVLRAGEMIIASLTVP
jgi:putative hemolysin